MAERYINFDLDDPRADKLAEALTNKTCKRILGSLVEKEMNASELATLLNLPLNTIGYNLDKLVEAGLIEKTKGFFWSSKGKKIERYKLSNKRIVISPRRIGMSVIPVILITGIVAMILKLLLGFSSSKSIASKAESASNATGPSFAAGGGAREFAQSATDEAARGTAEAGSLGYNLLVSFGYEWLWFLLGAIVGLLIFLIWNRKKIWV